MSLEENKKIAEADVWYSESGNASQFVKNRYSIGGIGVEGEGSRSLSSRSQWIVPRLIQLRKEGRNGT
jgi:hypothetical protein